MTDAAPVTSTARPTMRQRLIRHRVETFVVATFFLLGLAWLVSSPFGSAADETSHYVRVLGMSEGHPLGADLTPADVPFDHPPVNGHQVTQDRLVKEGGAFTIPGNAQPQYICRVGEFDQPYDCPRPGVSAESVRAISWHARTSPTSYVLPALLTRLGSGTTWKYLLARLGFLLQDTALFAVAVVASARLLRGSRPEVYLLALFAVTPLLAHQAGVLSPDGTEAFALLAFTAMLLALLAEPTRRRWWLTAALAALALWVRDLGLVLVPAIGVLVVLLSLPAARRVPQALRRVDVLAAAGVVAAAVGAFVWRAVLLYSAGLGDLTGHRLWRAAYDTSRVFLNSFGTTGAGDVPYNATLRLLWFAAAGGLALSLAWRDRRWGLTGLAFGALYVGLNVVIWLSQDALGFWLYSRYLLGLFPVAVLAMSVLFPNRGDSGRTIHWLVAPLTVLASVGHLSVYVLVGHRYAVGAGHPLSFRNATWRPTIGWAATFVFIGAACAAVAALALVVRSDRRPLRSGGRSSSSSAGP